MVIAADAPPSDEQWCFDADVSHTAAARQKKSEGSHVLVNYRAEEEKKKEKKSRKTVVLRESEQGIELGAAKRKGSRKVDTFSIYACHPCAGAMLIFSVSFQF